MFHHDHHVSCFHAVSGDNHRGVSFSPVRTNSIARINHNRISLRDCHGRTHSLAMCSQILQVVRGNANEEHTPPKHGPLIWAVQEKVVLLTDFPMLFFDARLDFCLLLACCSPVASMWRAP